MIVVDSSVWIDFFNGFDTAEVGRLRSYLGQSEIIIGDLILCEVLQGFDTEREVAQARHALRDVRIVAMVGPRIALKSAENYRTLRRRGVTVRKTIDLIIATYCIENGHALLHADRDFAPLTEHLGLIVA